ncbi:MAG TPA: NAD(P)-dependent alcohol dehydrogenase [Candidatus Acidoferrales bacterium]|nr:NAD(P)-dependent alcohol dehydrogenase [Candidatus Acidoferrales bacterium]
MKPQKITAAVVEKTGAPFVLHELELDAPRADEILVRIVAVGICQTDVHVRDRLQPTSLPAVLGHEGSGIVEEVGAAVTYVKPGDRVVLSYDSCGQCRFCLGGRNSYCEQAMPINFGGSRLDGTNALHRAGHGGRHDVHGHFFGQSSFATHALATERNVVRAPDDLPLELLGPLGCGLQTGAGAVLNSLRVPAGASIAILGTGAVGLAAVMAARFAGANPIVGVDLVPSRLALASEFGATHTIDARKEDIRKRIAEITGSGVDYALEITAQPEMLALAVDILAPCGTAGQIGGGIPGAKAAIGMSRLLLGRSVRGIIQGDSIPRVFIPKLIEMYRRGQFPFDRLVRFYDFAQINQAVADAASGETIKPILRVAAE